MGIPIRVLQEFGLQGIEIIEKDSNPRGTRWWRIRRNDAKLLLKAKRNEDPLQVRELHSIQMELSRSGAEVDNPYPAKSGFTVIEAEQYLWMLSSDIGSPRYDWSDQHFRKAGIALERFHKAGETLPQRRVPLRGPLVRFLPKTEDFLNGLSGRPLLGRQRRILQIVRNFYDRIGFENKYLSIPRTLIHGDFCERNIFWADNRLTGLIDLELLGNEIASFDLCFFTSEYLKNRANPNWQPIIKMLISGYSSIRNLDEREENLLDIILYLTTLYRFYDDNCKEDSLILLEKLLKV